MSEWSLWAGLGGLSGLIVGSFLATLVLRWPEGRGLGGRSACDGCGRLLRPVDLIPLLSFALLRGRCRACGGRIDWRHPAIELAAAGIGALAMGVAPGIGGAAGALFGWMLLTLGALDAEHYWLPDALTWPLLGLGLLLGLGDWQDRALGAVLGGGSLWLVAFAWRRWRGVEGLGQGDVKLFAGLGAWLNAAALPPLMLSAALLGLLSVGFRLWRGRPVARDMRLPLGALLAAVAFPLWIAKVLVEG
ncbi:prepilin peptidase [Sandaracinobacteroides saxicola]|uniref:Prepilin leader peptidase/N-methyltransferase n=2 Tax=Sandaracinobacteroides saxicola TaxID=2759707 RepID=A0A7G5IMM5_9SPHN|nr:prepilin peptidase [Sandaracinobacteroides saxicola]